MSKLLFERIAGAAAIVFPMSHWDKAMVKTWIEEHSYTYDVTKILENRYKPEHHGMYIYAILPMRQWGRMHEMYSTNMMAPYSVVMQKGVLKLPVIEPMFEIV